MPYMDPMGIYSNWCVYIVGIQTGKRVSQYHIPQGISKPNGDK